MSIFPKANLRIGLVASVVLSVLLTGFIASHAQEVFVQGKTSGGSHVIQSLNSVTVDNTDNIVGLTITQNDTTNNPKGISVTNAGTGNGIYIDANGNTGTTASSSGALFLDNTGNTGTGANFYTNGATVGSTGVLFAKVDNASASGPVARFDNDGTGNALQINANGNVGTSDTTSGALRITNTNNTGYAINVYSNAGASSGALARIHADNASFDQPALHIVQDGTSGGAASIRLDGVSPQIEFVEDDQTTPAGKFEIQVQGDRFFINGRNAGDSSFEGILQIDRIEDGGALTMIGGPIIKYTVAGITASTTQSQGQGALTGQINEISTVGSTNDTVTVPTAVAGLCVKIINNGANTLQIFPASGDNLGAGVNTATTLASGSNVEYCAYDTTNWESF